VNYPIYINISVVLTENNIRFFLPTGAVILIIFKKTMSLGKTIDHEQNTHSLHFIGVNDGSNGKVKSKPITEKWTDADNRMKYEAQYNKDTQLYTLNIYTKPLSNPPIAAMRFAVNVKKKNATYQEKTGKQEKATFKEKTNGTYIAQFRKKRRTVPYKIPAVSLSPKEEQENSPDMRTLEAYDTWPSKSIEPSDWLARIQMILQGLYMMAATPTFILAVVLIVLLLIRHCVYGRLF
jgi:hypothetical protein